MRRFFVASSLLLNDEVLITGELEHYLSDVLRLKIGSVIELTDGEHELCTVRLTEFESAKIKGEIIKRKAFLLKDEPEIYLYQGLPKGDKLDFIVQKCTELGVSGIIPVEMPRSIVKLSKDKAEKKKTRLEKIALEAAQQSKQDSVPKIGDILSWQEFLGSLSGENDLTLVLWEEENALGLKEALTCCPLNGRINLIIGPEGGMGAAEVAELRERGAVSVSLGKRILRTETAPIAAVAVISYHYGILGCV